MTKRKSSKDPKKYSYRLVWSEEDNEFVGLCAEFPSCSWLSQTPEKALHGIQKLVAGIVEDMARTKRDAHRRDGVTASLHRDCKPDSSAILV